MTRTLTLLCVHKVSPSLSLTCHWRVGRAVSLKPYPIKESVQVGANQVFGQRSRDYSLLIL
jgi:hypothetical protein